MGMVVATEELSRGSLGIGGSLVTRPEILTRALVAGGTEEQKQAWLPRIASGEVMVGIMVTEPDYGSDVAGVKVARHPDRRRLARERREDLGDVRRARRRAHAARATDPDRSAGHRGLSILVVEKPRAEGHSVRVRRRPRRHDRRPRDRHHRLPRHALLRGGVRQLVRARREPRGRRGRPRPRLLPPDGRLRERPPADRGPRRRPDAGGVRSGPRVRAGSQGVRRARVRLPALQAQARRAWPR